MTDKQKTAEAVNIIENLMEKYFLEDICDILTAARLRAKTMIYCGSCSAKEPDGPPIDESELPF